MTKIYFKKLLSGYICTCSMHLKIHSYQALFHINFHVFHNLEKIFLFLFIKCTFSCEENILSFPRHLLSKRCIKFYVREVIFYKKIADFHQTKTQHSLEKIQPEFLATSFLFLKRFLKKLLQN